MNFKSIGLLILSFTGLPLITAQAQTVTDLGPHAVDNGAKIINCSWGEELKSPELEEAITYALLRDVVIVASAGNLGINNDFYFHYPSHHAGVITVANLDTNQHLAYFSNYGTRTVDIGAPGEDILSTWVDGSFQKKSGTSMAALRTFRTNCHRPSLPSKEVVEQKCDD